MTTAEFSNEQLSETQYPSIFHIDTLPLDPAYAKANRLLLLTIALLVALIFAAVLNQPWFELPEKLAIVLTFAGIGISCLFLLLTVYHIAADPKKSYALREHDLSYSSGLVFRQCVTQPITRIQHIELKRGPIERKVGLATLEVFSAGGALHTFEIPGLKLATAQQIRQFILQHKDAVKHG